jgi:hypothetical protein
MLFRPSARRVDADLESGIGFRAVAAETGQPVVGSALPAAVYAAESG